MVVAQVEVCQACEGLHACRHQVQLVVREAERLEAREVLELWRDRLQPGSEESSYLRLIDFLYHSTLDFGVWRRVRFSSSGAVVLSLVQVVGPRLSVYTSILGDM